MAHQQMRQVEKPAFFIGCCPLIWYAVSGKTDGYCSYTLQETCSQDVLIEITKSIKLTEKKS